MIVSDIEANALLESVTKFHCGVIYDYSTAEYVSYRPSDFGAYLDALEAEVARGGLIVFHNGHKYDVPALTKLAKLQLNREFHLPRENCIDTLVLSRLIHSNLKDTDMGLLRSGKLPGMLEEQGEEYVDGMEWWNFNEEMMDYNVQDVVVTKALLEKLLSDKHYFPPEIDFTDVGYTTFWSESLEAVDIEHRAAWLLAKKSATGSRLTQKQSKSCT